MKRVFLPLFFCNVLFVQACTCDSDAVQQTFAADDKGIVILHDNDVHCNYQQGYMAMSRMQNAISDTAWVAMVSAGDFMQGKAVGAVSKGIYIIDIMRSMQYDAVTIGNHEFDYGIAHMHSALTAAGANGEAALPVTCVNYLNTQTASPVFTPYIIKQYGKRSVAFIGVVTPATLTSEGNSFIDAAGQALPYDITDGDKLVNQVQQTVDSVRQAGADYVVILSHLGNADTMPYLTSQALINRTRGIDAVLDGHTHLVYTNREKNLDGQEIPVSQTGTQFANIGKLFISPEGRVSSEMVPLQDTVKYAAEPSAAVVAAVAAVNKKMSVFDHDTVAYTPFALTVMENGVWTVRSQETNLGDLATDALRHYTGADVAIYNGGSLRNDIPAGYMSTSVAVGAMPYYNDLRKIKVTGTQLQQLLDTCCCRAPVVNGTFPQVSGLRFRLTEGGTRAVVSEVEVLDAATSQYVALDPQRTYTLASSDYFISGTEYGGLLAEAPIVESYVITGTEVFLKYLRETLRGVVPEVYRLPQNRIRK